MAKVVWLPEALQDVTRLYEFLAEKSLEAACRAADRIGYVARQLEQFPELGQPMDDGARRQVSPFWRRCVCDPISLRPRGERRDRARMAFSGAARKLAVCKLRKTAGTGDGGSWGCGTRVIGSRLTPPPRSAWTGPVRPSVRCSPLRPFHQLRVGHRNRKVRCCGPARV